MQNSPFLPVGTDAAQKEYSAMTTEHAFFVNDSILIFPKKAHPQKMRNHSLAILQKQGVIFLIAGLTVFFLLSDLISPVLYVLPLVIGISTGGASHLPRKERKEIRTSVALSAR